MDDDDATLLEKNLKELENEISQIKGTIGWLWGTGGKGDRLFCVKRVVDETGQKVIFRDSLQLENLDLNELEGSINSLSLLLSEYSEQILEFSKY